MVTSFLHHYIYGIPYNFNICYIVKRFVHHSNSNAFFSSLLDSSAFYQLKYISGTISNTWYFLFSFSGGVTRGSSLSPDLQTLMLCIVGHFLLHL